MWRQKQGSGTLLNTQVKYDNNPLLLSDAINYLKARKMSFKEPELWNLLYTICHAEEEYGRVSGHQGKLVDIRPVNIFLSDKGKARVANPLSWPGMETNEAKIKNGEIVFLAPEELKKLKDGEIIVPDSDSNEMFAIGMTMLSAGILKDSEDLYDYKQYTFDYEEADTRINFWLTRNQYTENLRMLVAYMCSYRQYKRWTIDELWKWLGKNRVKIGANEFHGHQEKLPEMF